MQEFPLNSLPTGLTVREYYLPGKARWKALRLDFFFMLILQTGNEGKDNLWDFTAGQFVLGSPGFASISSHGLLV